MTTQEPSLSMPSYLQRVTSPELVAYIFELTLPPPGTAYRTNEAPLLVSQICRGWRLVALSTPVLWTHLKLVLPLARRAPAAWEECINQASAASLLMLARSVQREVSMSVVCVLRASVSGAVAEKGEGAWLPTITAFVTRLLFQHGQRHSSCPFHALYLSSEVTARPSNVL